VSRIGRLPITVPAGVKVDINGSEVTVKGPKGELKRLFSPMMSIEQEGNEITVKRPSDEASVRALHGTTRALLHNMVVGVSDGFTVVLEVEGVGYRPEMNGKNLVLYVGYSSPKEVVPPAGITFEVDLKAKPVQIKVMGYDREMVGQVAANIRGIRPVEPYKGKGIHYQGERIRRKAGKSGKAKK
jgi:large subunit ribosomal protein L6